MFMNVAKELQAAKFGGYAIGAFNTSNLEVTKAICLAAREMDFPVIIQTTPSAIKYAGLKQIYDIVRNEIEESGIKAAIHLDHGKDWDVAKACVDIGYPSVMIDGSKLPYDENVALTKKVVEYAHERGVAVEAEIGVLGVEEGGESGSARGDSFSSPGQTAEFVKKTGIDSVAVAIGNAHGAPAGEKLDLGLLHRISKTIDIPLVIHGSSGLEDSDIITAIRSGVAKFNVDTLIRRSYLDGIYSVPKEEKDYRNLFEAAMVPVVEVVKQRIKLFSNN
ncbi:MAG: Fructose-bisphosphate aldolase [bacterium ADurb.Bin400]|nr:MAG: Fructose-bisphosphate aldolase [bacterium ADurb.Bin400]